MCCFPLFRWSPFTTNFIIRCFGLPLPPITFSRLSEPNVGHRFARSFCGAVSLIVRYEIAWENVLGHWSNLLLNGVGEYVGSRLRKEN